MARVSPTNWANSRIHGNWKKHSETNREKATNLSRRVKSPWSFSSKFPKRWKDWKPEETKKDSPAITEHDKEKAHRGISHEKEGGWKDEKGNFSLSERIWTQNSRTWREKHGIPIIVASLLIKVFTEGRERP